MSAGKYSLLIEKGATFKRVLTYKDSAGALINLTGYSARMHIRSDIAEATTIFSFATPPGSGLTIDPLVGRITLLISSNETAAVTFDEGVYDLELVLGAEVSRVMQGKVKFVPEVTR